MYIEAGLFWGFVILAIIALSVIYTTLNNKIFQQRLKNEELLKKIAKAKYANEDGASEDVEMLKKQLSDALDDLSFLYMVVGLIAENSNNTTKTKVENLIHRRNTKTKRNR